VRNPLVTTRLARHYTTPNQMLDAARPTAPAPTVERATARLACGHYISWTATGGVDGTLDNRASAAVVACDQLLAEARERGVPPTTWHVQQLEALRARLLARSDKQARPLRGVA
jgi:hypothetical protein